MDRILDILEQRNQYLEKFLLIGEAELVNFKANDFDNLESFYDCRERILNIITHLEQKFEMTMQQFTENNILDDDVRNDFKRTIEKKDLLVKGILEQDLRIISCIEEAKSDVIRELRDVKKARHVVSSYRSPDERPAQVNEEV